MPKFSVTYEIVSPESAENGEAEDMGYVVKDCSLREAMELCGLPSGACESDCYPINAPRWFSNYEYNQDWATGYHETRSLHLPANATVASRNRVARLLGLKVAH